MSKTEKLLYPLSILIVAFLAFYLGFLYNETKGIIEARLEREAELRLLEPPPIEISYVVLKPVVSKEKFTYTGTVIPWRSSKISFSIPGKIQKIYKHAGMRVKKGEVLAELDLEKIKTDLEAARADFKKAEWDKNRIEELYKKGSASENDLKRVNLLFDLKLAQLKRAEKNLKDSYLKVPFKGIISKKYIEEGEYALPQVPAFQIIDIEKVKILVYIPESRIHKLKEGCIAFVRRRKVEGAIFKGKIYKIYPEGENHLFPVEIEVNNTGMSLKPGMIVDATIETGKQEKVYRLPVGAVLEEGDDKWVMLMEENSKIIIGYFDLGFISKARRNEAVKKMGVNIKEKAWMEIEKDLWNKSGLTHREKLKCATTYRKAHFLKGPGIIVYKKGCVARKKELKHAKLIGDKWIIPYGKDLKPGDKLIVMGGHRVSDGTPVYPVEGKMSFGR